MNPDDRSVFGPNIIGKRDKLHSVCLAGFASSNTRKVVDVPIESDEIKIYTAQVSNMDDGELNANIIILKNEFDEMQICSWRCISRLNKVSKLKNPKEQNLKLVAYTLEKGE